MSRFRYAVGSFGMIAMLGLAGAHVPALGPPDSGGAPQQTTQAQPPPGQSTQGQPPPKTEAKPAAGDSSQAQQGQKPQQPVFKAGVNIVRVDIIVTDRQGNPVTDLTQADFEVLEDGKPQTVDLFHLINSDGNPAPGAEAVRPIRSMYDEEAEAARDDVRLFVIFLDDYHVRLQNAMRVRDPLIQFVTTQLGPLDMVAIMYPLTPVTGMTFTRNRDELVQAIRKFEGRKGNYSPRNPIEQQYAFAPPQAVETVRNEVTLTALRGLPVRLGSLREGRKAVIFVSEGFVGLLPAQVRGGVSGLLGMSPPAGDPQAEDRARFQAEMDLQEQLKLIFDSANRNNTAIYALDPRGLATNEYDMSDGVGQSMDLNMLRSSQDTLHVLANNTDGRAIINRNDLAAGLKQVVRDTSSYYMVGYNSTLPAPDGKYHRIDVKLKRPGMQIRARKGYWAPTAEEAARAAAPPKPRPPAAVEKALSGVETRVGDTVIAVWIGTDRGTDGRTRVTYVWEPLPPVPGEKRLEAARVSIVATSSGGDTYYRGRSPETAPGAAAPAETTAAPALRAPSKVSFDVRPGKMQLRTEVETAAGQVIDDARQEHSIPDFTEQKVMLSTPLVLCARTAREFQALSRDTDPIPTAIRQFRRTDRLIIRFAAYAPAAAAPQVTVRLLNRVGQKMSDLTAKPPDGGVDFYQIDLPLAGLSAGEYLIEVKAAGGGTDATELVAMRIVS